MKLFIVESPGKIKTISKYLGNDFLVKASVGHCYQIEPSDHGVDIENNFEPKYVVIDGKNKVVEELKKIAKDAELCYIATDDDREGESIGTHIAKRVIGKSCPIKRVRFHEITQSAITHAVEHPGELDQHLFHAQQARSVLDLLVGFKVSPKLWYAVARGTSAGRVQSIGLRIIVDRQVEIDAFVPEEYWSIEAQFQTIRNDLFVTAYKIATDKKLKTEQETKEVVDLIKKIKQWKIESIEKSQKTRKPAPLFQTSTMQQFCSSTFGWDAKRTMSIAQKLYEAGLITYHRTDCVNISPQAITDVRTLISKIGSEYLPTKPIIYKSKASAQEAHEGIRPAHIEYTLNDVKDKVEQDEFKLYEVIFRRFVSCQMTDAKFDSTKIEIISDDKKHIFTTNGNTLTFDGFLLVWTYSDSKETVLPLMNKNEIVNLNDVKGIQHFTKPPASYNDASLIKFLEEKGIGRPSTYASIIDTLQKRKYVEKKNKAFIPTELGKKVCQYLVQYFPELMNLNYTARMETELDEIAEAKKIWYQVVGNFYNELKIRLDATKGTETRKPAEETNFTCPTCQKNKLVKRSGRFGDFYGCAGFINKGKNKCSATFQIGENGEPYQREKPAKQYLEGKACSCGGALIIRTSKRTSKQFAGCEKFPKCKKIYTMEGEPISFD